MDIMESSDYDFAWAIELHRLSLEVIGLWPTGSKKFSKKNLWPQIHSGIVLILLIFIFIPMILMLIHVRDNMVLVIDSLHIILPLITIIIKYIIMRWKQTVLFAIINMMAEDWTTFKHFAERSAMIRRARSARLIMLIAYIIAIIGFLLVTVPPYFGIPVLYTTNRMNRSRLLPLESFHFYNTDKSPQYELTFFIHSVTVLLAAIIYMSTDIFLILLIFHICGQLEIFRRRLVSLVLCTKFNEVLSDIITAHLRLIRFAENIENMYSVIMLIMLLYFALVFCLNGFLFVIFLVNKKIDDVVVTEIFFSIFFFIVLLMNTFLYCGAGELIMEQCNAIHRALYDIKWYKIESKKAKNLILLMVRTYHPFRITAGKIIPLTMTTFGKVLKTSCGYISFLLTKHD